MGDVDGDIADVDVNRVAEVLGPVAPFYQRAINGQLAPEIDRRNDVDSMLPQASRGLFYGQESEKTQNQWI